MIVCFHLAAFLVNEYCFTPEWQRHVREITREVVDCMAHVQGREHGPRANAVIPCFQNVLP